MGRFVGELIRRVAEDAQRCGCSGGNLTRKEMWQCHPGNPKKRIARYGLQMLPVPKLSNIMRAAIGSHIFATGSDPTSYSLEFGDERFRVAADLGGERVDGRDDQVIQRLWNAGGRVSREGREAVVSERVREGLGRRY